MLTLLVARLKETAYETVAPLLLDEELISMFREVTSPKASAVPNFIKGINTETAITIALIRLVWRFSQLEIFIFPQCLSVYIVNNINLA